MSDLISRQDAIDAMATWDWQELYLPIHFKQLLEDIPSADRYIDRAELFNRLAEIKSPPEANEYKAAVYSLIQSM